MTIDEIKNLYANPNRTCNQTQRFLNEARALRGARAQAFADAALSICRHEYEQSRAAEAVPLARAAAHLAQKTGAPALQIRAHAALGNLLGDCGDLLDALREHKIAEELARASGSARDEANAICNGATVLFFAGAFERALTEYHRAAQLGVGTDVEYRACNNVGLTAASVGRHQEGLAAMAQCAEIEMRNSQSTLTRAQCRSNHVRLLMLAGRAAEVPPLLADLAKFAELEATPRIELCHLTALGMYERVAGDATLGQQLLAEALAVAATMRDCLADTLLIIQQAEQLAGGCGGEEVGQELVSLALEAATTAGSASGVAVKIKLSLRERQIVSLLPASNKDVARRLNISEAAVSQALSRLYAKLGASSKSEALKLLNEQPADDTGTPNSPGFNRMATRFAVYAVQNGLALAMGAMIASLMPAEQECLNALEGGANPLTAVVNAPIHDIRWLMAAFFDAKQRGDTPGAETAAQRLYAALHRRELLLAGLI